MIRVEAIWLATAPLDMRAGTDAVLARVVKVFGSAQPHHAYPFAKALHEGLIARRARITPGTATAGAIDYSLKHWVALTRYLEDPALPILDQAHDGRGALARHQGAGEQPVLPARGPRPDLLLVEVLNGHDPYAYTKDVLTRLPTHQAREFDALLPHRWEPLN